MQNAEDKKTESDATLATTTDCGNSYNCEVDHLRNENEKLKIVLTSIRNGMMQAKLFVNSREGIILYLRQNSQSNSWRPEHLWTCQFGQEKIPVTCQKHWVRRSCWPSKSRGISFGLFAQTSSTVWSRMCTVYQNRQFEASGYADENVHCSLGIHHYGGAPS